MMKFILLILTIISFQISAAADEIVAIVNKKPITSSELQQRKKLMMFFNHVPTLTAEQDKIFTYNILQSMIDGEVLSQYAQKINMKVSDQEMQNFIKYMETANKMPEGQIEKSIANAHISNSVLKDLIRIEILRPKIANEIVGQQVTVTRNDVDSVILDTNSRDAKLSLTVFSARRNTDKAYRSMSKLSSKIRNCKHLPYLSYQSFATMSNIETTLSALAPNVQGLIKDMSVGEATGAIKNDKIQVFVLCGKKIEDFSDTDAGQVHQMVANKQLNTKARKFLQNLRKKAYVKVM